MDNEHSIESLIELFRKHAVEAEIQRAITRQRHEKEFGTPLPYYDSFSLPMALMTICKERYELRKKSMQDM